ncbi:MAG: hypothetical protein EPN93_07480 [Spirochaetes bacterium]|nr:MAG: hypothetical protein EPN93_07480 [Spirochaetota bacterium]
MKIIVTVTLQVKRGSLPYIVGEIHARGCELQRSVRRECTQDSEVFDLEIIAGDNQALNGLIEEITQQKSGSRLIQIENLLEDSIVGGMLRVSGKLAIESPDDYDTKLLGATGLLFDKISQGRGTEYSGIARSVLFLSAMKSRADAQADRLYQRHAGLERDCVIFNLFTGMNAYPLIVRYVQMEDLIRTIQAVSPGFAAVRVVEAEEMDDVTDFDQLRDCIDVPVLSAATDEMPLCMLAEIITMVEKSRMEFYECNLGMIGITASALRLTRMLLSLGCPRVLGYDNNEKLMMLFEKSGGLATTPENIFNNSDVVILNKNHFTVDDLHRIRSGQKFLSLIEEDLLEKNIIADKGIRTHVTRDQLDTSLVFPGLLRGMIKSRRESYDNDTLIELARRLKNIRAKEGNVYTPMGGIHARIEEIVCAEL